jgi:hypothetical protein
MDYPDHLSDGRAPVCAGCGGPLPEDFVTAREGRGYCPDCVPEEKPEEAPVETLGEFAERKARDAVHGRGQTRLVG